MDNAGNISLSVLTYVKNDVLHIERCMKSVMSQTYSDLEYIVIDGGSTDGTLDIIERLAGEDARIKVIHSEPGLGHQFNTGLKAACGEYIGICESDDYLLPDMYMVQMEIAKREKIDILRADSWDFFEINGKEVRLPYKIPGISVEKDKVLTQADINPLCTGIKCFFSGLYRREFLLENEIFMNETAGAAYQDNTFIFLSLIMAKKVWISSQAFYCYCIDNPNSSCNAPRDQKMISKEYELLKARLKEKRMWETYKEEFLLWFILNHFWFGSFLEQENREAYAMLFYESLYAVTREESFDEKKLRQQDTCLLEQMKLSEDHFCKYVTTKWDSYYEMWDRIKILQKEDKVVIFGAGNIGQLILRILKIKGIPVRAFCDNEKSKQSSCYMGIEVYSPEQAVSTYIHDTYIIANIDYGEVMKQQLIQLGISQENIIICSNYDFIVKKILMQTYEEK